MFPFLFSKAWRHEGLDLGMMEIGTSREQSQHFGVSKVFARYAALLYRDWRESGKGGEERGKRKGGGRHWQETVEVLALRPKFMGRNDNCCSDGYYRPVKTVQ